MKQRMSLIKNSFILPSIKSPVDIKNSLTQIIKAKIYGVNINNHPLLKNHKEKYRAYMKKIRQKIKMRRSPDKKKEGDDNKAITEQDNDEQSTKKVASILPNISLNVSNSAIPADDQ